jgi:tetratricopeptide (TPR) repeat protein
MNVTRRLNFLILCAGLVFSAGRTPRIFAAETEPVSSSSPTNSIAWSTLNAYLQIQDQLRETQLAIASNRQETASALQHEAADTASRLQLLEQTVAAQSAQEVASAQKIQQITLALVGAFGVAGLAAILLMVYFQWRAMSRLVELTALHPPGLALANDRPPPARAAVELSNARLLNVVERLEKRILELEEVSRLPLGETVSPAAAPSNGAETMAEDGDGCVADLLSEGQTLLAANEPEKALELFDRALAIQPHHAEALIKKGSALEKLERLDDAIACYDQAIRADGSKTIAWLHKGGLFNRLSRYDEALQCYEQALRTQEKGAGKP